jgi:hypothetical protein
MFLVLKGEMLHRREHSAERAGNLYHERYLLVKVQAVKKYAKGIHLGPTGIDSHTNVILKEPEYDTVAPKILCCVYELQETRDRNCELAEKVNIELLEARGGDPMSKCFQVSTNTTELEIVEVRVCDGCGDRRVRKLPFYIAARNNGPGLREKYEHLQLGHE